MRSLLSLLLLSFVCAATIPSVFAAPVTLELHPDCCGRQYDVYGEQQPQGSVRLNQETGHYEGDCTVTVDLGDLPEVGDSPEEPDSGLFGSVTGALESTAAPLTALFESVGLKKALLEFASPVYLSHTRPYHRFLDEEIFEPMIEVIAEYETSEALNQYLEEQDAQCSVENPKPECVIERTLCSYEKYVGVLFHQSGQSVLDTSPGADLSNEELGQVLAVIQQRDQALMEEARHVFQALDTAIAVYSQYYETYRLHLSFKKVIDSLVKVRNLTSYMRELVGCVPGKFVGAATTKCN